MAPFICSEEWDHRSNRTSSRSSSSSTTTSDSLASSILDCDAEDQIPDKAEDKTCSQMMSPSQIADAISHVRQESISSGRPEAPVSRRSEEPRLRKPTLEDGKVTDTFMKDLIEYYKNQERLGCVVVNRILADAKNLLMTYPALVDIDLRADDTLNVCGDIHGQLFDLINIFDKFGYPSASNQYLFNGDFVDRGPWSVEVMMVLLGYKLLYPDHFFLGRGNHEAEEVNKLYGFQNEVMFKYDSEMFSRFQSVFNWLPVAHVVNKQILVAHGGIPSQEGVTIDDIRQLPRGIQPPKQGVMCDLLWSDPRDEDGIAPNSRGYSCLFGPDVTDKFLRLNRLTYVIRSHECMPYGYDLCHDDKVVTVFSAPNYCDRYGNKGAVCILHGDDVTMPEFKKFEAVPHPQVEDMKFASIYVKLGMI